MLTLNGVFREAVWLHDRRPVLIAGTFGPRTAVLTADGCDLVEARLHDERTG